jgi:hypothetical protein
MDGDRLPLDIFDGEIGLPSISNTGVIEPGDAGVSELRQDVSFPGETLGQSLVVQGNERQLERHRTLYFAIRPFGQPNNAHTALPQFAQQTIRADDRRGGKSPGSLRPVQVGQGFQKINGFGALVPKHQLSKHREHRGMLGSKTFQPIGARLSRQVKPFVEKFGKRWPGFRIDSHHTAAATGLTYMTYIVG